MEKFIDMPVKRYSSGMHVRLAFAVAMHLDPEMLRDVARERGTTEGTARLQSPEPAVVCYIMSAGVALVSPLNLLTGGRTMIAVKAVYDQGNIQFLEPTPRLDHALVAVVFLDPSSADAVLPSARETERAMDWGESIDDEGARELLAVHEQLAPYRAEAEEACLHREEA